MIKPKYGAMLGEVVNSGAPFSLIGNRLVGSSLTRLGPMLESIKTEGALTINLMENDFFTRFSLTFRNGAGSVECIGVTQSTR